jgi:hypothetical protein
VRRYAWGLLLFCIAAPASSHPGRHRAGGARVWRLLNHRSVRGRFLAERDSEALVQTGAGKVVRLPLQELSPADRAYVGDWEQRIQRLNGAESLPTPSKPYRAPGLLIVGLSGSALLGAGVVRIRRSAGLLSRGGMLGWSAVLTVVGTTGVTLSLLPLTECRSSML